MLHQLVRASNACCVLCWPCAAEAGDVREDTVSPVSEALVLNAGAANRALGGSSNSPPLRFKWELVDTPNRLDRSWRSWARACKSRSAARSEASGIEGWR